MTKLGLLGAAAVLSTALASPLMAQQVITNPGRCAQYYPDANCQNYGPGNPYTDGHQRHVAYRNSYNRWDGRDTGFWPGDVAAGLAGGAVGTAGAIATAPIGGAAYARDNGFVCVPGSWFKGEDGRRHICQ
jgi:hypothetical protein